MRTEGIKAFSNGYGFVVWTGENDTKTISVDANLFENGGKQLRFRLDRASETNYTIRVRLRVIKCVHVLRQRDPTSNNRKAEKFLSFSRIQSEKQVNKYLQMDY